MATGTATTSAERRVERQRRVAAILASGPAATYERVFPLLGCEIKRSGDGRTVEAYAAMFDTPYEVRDQLGHYRERIHRAAFDRALAGGRMPVCLYNHGMSLTGSPDALASVPLGTPLEVRPDRRGLLTVTRYNKSALSEAVLEAIRAGDIRAQSFRGRIVRSSPERVPVRRPGEPLPEVTRLELGLSDYGPTPIPVNEGAAIVAVRGARVPVTVDELDRCRAELERVVQRAEWMLRTLRQDQEETRARLRRELRLRQIHRAARVAEILCRTRT